MIFFAPSKLFRNNIGFILLFLLSGCSSGQEETIPVSMLSNESRSNPIYGNHVRTSDFQTPEEERLDFVVPKGFKVTLFASEPDISKPMNIAFDHRGRLWVTQSSEYPLAAEIGKGKDKITILEDTNGDGKADKFTDFADDLNIPIGILPVRDGAIAYSIPNIYHFSDTNNDGISDSRKVLFGPFGYKDTHGMINNFKRGFDGWIYGDHGYTNTSTVAGTDRDSITMISGNTYRFREDGSRIEQTTYGRVNPFGYAYDQWGYLYSADCHSRPLYQLIPQGHYPHFGKKPPELGFAPEMMNFNLGSTALAGLVYYTGNQFPEEYQNCFYTGDVVTCRIDRTGIELTGTTPVAMNNEPLLVSKDPWFRPVDIKMGPDGALYVADFYNRIIGHYEVDLQHEGRDRKSGRIWRITYEGNKEASPLPDLTTLSLENLIALLDDDDLQTRMNAADYLVDEYGNKVVPAIKNGFLSDTESAYTTVQKMWILHRLGALNTTMVNHLLSNDDPLVLVHAIRMVGEQESISESTIRHLYFLLSGGSPHVQRAVIESLSRHPRFIHLNPFIHVYQNAPEEDTHLRYSALLGIQQCLAIPDIMAQVVKSGWLDDQFKVLISPLLDLPSIQGARFVLQYLETNEPDIGMDEELSRYMAKSGDQQAVDGWIVRMRRTYGAKPSKAISMARQMEEGFLIGSQTMTEKFINWEVLLVRDVFRSPGFNTLIGNNQQEISENDLKQILWVIGKSAELKIDNSDQMLVTLFHDAEMNPEVREAAANALVILDKEQYGNEILELFKSKDTPDDFKVRLAAAVSHLDKQLVMPVLESQLKIGNRPLQLTIARYLASFSEGIDRLLTYVENEDIRLDIIQDRKVIEAAQPVISAEQMSRVGRLNEKWGDDIERRNKIVQERIDQFTLNKDQVRQGQGLFKDNCLMCHQVAGEGKVIGPQLDGIANWGPQALIQKILDPNRNISSSFRTYNITLKDGSRKSGLFRRQEGNVKVFADAAGEEFRIPEPDISEQSPSTLTLMPDEFLNILDGQELNALVNYLLTIK